MAYQYFPSHSSLPQRSDVQIIRVALYARVSTLNNQDPEVQLRELRRNTLRIRGSPILAGS